MGFFSALKRLLPHAGHAQAGDESRQRIRAAWGLDDDEADTDTANRGDDSRPANASTGTNASAFDRAQWQKKLRRILDELPGSQPQWHDLMTEAHALQLDPDWIAGRQREEFSFIVRRAVADKVISESDHHKLELAQADRYVRGRSRNCPACNPGRSRSLLRFAGQGSQVMAEPQSFWFFELKAERY